MEHQEPIRTAIERNVKAVTLRPGVGQGTARTRARLRPGLACEVTEGPYAFTVGMTEKYGGSGAGPNPGVYGRGAVASCLTIGLSMWAARLGVPLAGLEVEVEADYDVRGELGVDATVSPGHAAMRYRVTIETDAPEDDVSRLIEVGLRTSSWLDNIARAVPMTGTVDVRRPATA